MEQKKTDFVAQAEAGMAQAAEEINKTLTESPIASDGDIEVIAKLKNYVTRHKLAMSKDNKNYLRAEAWQYLLALKGVTPCFDSAAEVHTSRAANGKDVRQYIVTTICELKNAEGKTISRAGMIASNYEKFLKDKPLYATWGMSQTRALSRAARNMFGYIAVGAGFEAVPWDEIN